MANNGPKAHPGPSHRRPGTRHRLTRSITESASLPTLGKLRFGQIGNSPGASNSSSVHQPQQSAAHLSRRDRHDECGLSASLSVRGSLDLPRLEDGASSHRTPSRTPSHSRRPSGSAPEDHISSPSPMNRPGSRPTASSKAWTEHDKVMARQRMALVTPLSSAAEWRAPQADEDYYDKPEGCKNRFPSSTHIS
jgi:hypothetical protein